MLLPHVFEIDRTHFYLGLSFIVLVQLELDHLGAVTTCFSRQLRKHNLTRKSCFQTDEDLIIGIVLVVGYVLRPFAQIHSSGPDFLFPIVRSLHLSLAPGVPT